jgi:hypothetical protein
LKKVKEILDRINILIMIILGNHETLMNARGVYYGLVEAQNLRGKSNDQKELEDDEISSMMI